MREDRKYDQHYFHGVGSNYSKTGYNPSLKTFESIIEFIISRKGRNVSLLDVGCAFGFLVKIAHEKGVDAYGLDISSYAIDKGKEINWTVKNRLFIGECEKTDAIFGRDRFDVIVALEVIEHTPTPEDVLTSLCKSLKVGGILLITTPHRRRRSDRDETHISIKSLNQWIYLLKRIGFNVKAPYFFQDRMIGRGSLKRMLNWGLSCRVFSKALRITIGYMCMLESNELFMLLTKEGQ